MSALLSANEIRLTYGYQTLLDGVTLAIAAGEKADSVPVPALPLKVGPVSTGTTPASDTSPVLRTV